MDESRIFQYPAEDMGHEYVSYHAAHDEENNGINMDHPQISGENHEHDQSMMMHAYQVIESEESMLDPQIKPKAVHQCPVCNKIFVSFKGLQQHAIIHTDQKPFECDICRKSFRFKSNLFEHRSVHTGTTPHQCPICGKTCRLKGNLKKHLRTHCATKEDLEAAWRPFASNRRAPAEIPQDAIIIRPSADATTLFTPPSRPRKKKIGLGTDSKSWVEKIRRGEFLPVAPIAEKMRHLLDLVKMSEGNSLDMDALFVHAQAIPFERFDCPLCKSLFHSRMECQQHIDSKHQNAPKQRPHFCEICLKSFGERQQLVTHQEHHKRIQMMLENNEFEIINPQPMVPVLNDGEEGRMGEEEDDEGGGHPLNDGGGGTVLAASWGDHQ